MEVIIGSRNHNIRRRLVAGAAAGAMAGAAAAFVLMLVSAAYGQGFWFPMQLVSGIFFGVDAILGGFGAGFAGTIAFLVGSAVPGAIFALLLPTRMSSDNLLMAGLGWGIAVWALRSFAILPLVNTMMSERLGTMVGWWFSAHLVYGAVLSITPNLIKHSAPAVIVRTIREEWRKAA